MRGCLVWGIHLGVRLCMHMQVATSHYHCHYHSFTMVHRGCIGSPPCYPVCTPHLCDAALHNEEVGVVHVQLHRVEQVLYTAARIKDGGGSCFNQAPLVVTVAVPVPSSDAHAVHAVWAWWSSHQHASRVHKARKRLLQDYNAEMLLSTLLCNPVCCCVCCRVCHPLLLCSVAIDEILVAATNDNLYCSQQGTSM